MKRPDSLSVVAAVLGTALCPRIHEVPLLEPLVCKKIAQERLTVLLFLEDCIITACQEGLICTWARPGKAVSLPLPAHRDPGGGGPWQRASLGHSFQPPGVWRSHGNLVPEKGSPGLRVASRTLARQHQQQVR